MPNVSNYKAELTVLIDEEMTRLDVSLDLHSISPNQYVTEGEGAQPSPGESTVVLECWPGNDNSEFPVNTGYTFCKDTAGDATYIPIFCDAGLTKCKINFNASNDLLSMFDIFTSTDSSSTSPESTYNRYTGDKDVYIFFKSKNAGYSIYSPGITQTEGYTFAEGQSILIDGNRGNIGHICRIEEPIPKEVLAAAIDRTATITVDLTGMETKVWDAINTSSPQNIGIKYRVSGIYESMGVGFTTYEPKKCYAVMGNSAGDISEPGQSWEQSVEFPNGKTAENAILRMSIVDEPSISVHTYSEMATIANVSYTNYTVDYRIGMSYERGSNKCFINFYSVGKHSYNSSGVTNYYTYSVYVYLKWIYTSRFDDAYR